MLHAGILNDQGKVDPENLDPGCQLSTVKGIIESTPLCEAAACGIKGAVEVLVDAGADLNKCNRFDGTHLNIML